MKSFRGRSQMRVVIISLIGVVALIAAACSGSDSASSGSGGDDSTDVVDLGLVAAFSGSYADIGESIERGAEVAIAMIEEDGGTVNLTIADDQGDPQLSTQRVNELASNGIHLTFGYALSPGCLAAAQAANQLGSLVMSSACAGVNLVEDDLQPSFFRVSPSDEMFQYAVAALVAEEYPDITTWSVIGPDYDVGHSMWRYFQEFLAERGIDVETRNEVFHPLDATDMTPYITAVMRGASPDEGLLITDTSGLLLNVIKQAQPYDMVGAFGAVVNGGGFLPQAYALGSDVPEMWNVYRWADGAIDNEIAKEFEAKFNEMFPDDHIDSLSVNGFTAVYAYWNAVQEAGSTNADAVAEALVGLSFESIEGTVTIGDNHQASGPMLGRYFVPDPSAEDGFVITETRELPSDPSME